MGEMQNEWTPGTLNKCNENLERLSNIEIEGRSPSFRFNCLTTADSNQITVNKHEDRFEQLEKRISSLEDLINKESGRPKTVLENKSSGKWTNLGHLKKI